MISVNKDTVVVDGHPKDLCAELTVLISGFRDTLVKEMGLPIDDVNNAIARCIEIAFMSPEERGKYLNSIINDYKNKH